MTTDRRALITGHDGRAGIVRLDKATALRIDIMPIDSGGVYGGLILDGTATPPHVYPSGAGLVASQLRLMPPLVWGNGGTSPTWTLTGYSAAYYRADSGDSLGFSLYQMPREGTASAGSSLLQASVAGGQFATHGSWQTQAATGLSISLDFSAYTYALSWSLQSSGSGSDIRIGPAFFTVSASEVF